MLFHKLIGWHHRHHHTGRIFRRISRKLTLDEYQQVKFENLQIAWNRARTNLQKIRSERDEMLESMLNAPTINQDEILRVVNIPQLSLNEEMPSVIELYSDFHTSLNQSQREQLLMLWHKYQQKWQGCRQ
ncbi:MAG: hypothetical protein OEY52_16490 [Gammaproteobacteria bacterium]|nr:hypothetical protein [Gammaproteobacteria bacterium]